MSGGRFNYVNDNAASELFGYKLYPDYGSEGFGQAAVARKLDPLEDKQLSELVWDIFCVLHSYDWYASGDTGEEVYREDVKYFKEKWLGKTQKELIKEEVEKAISEARTELFKSFGIEK
jgi:hypothetical protein